MTAQWSLDRSPDLGDPRLPGAAPASIREALLPDGRDELFRCLEHWRRIAVLQRDPDRFASVVRRAAERLGGEPVPDGEPLAETCRRVGV